MRLGGVAEPLDRRSAAILLLPLFALALGAWIVADHRMTGMDAGPGTDLGTAGFFVTTWVVMMAAMMFPSAWPAMLAHAQLRSYWSERTGASTAGGGPAFAAGYLATWTIAGLAAYALFELVRSLSIGIFAWDRGGPYVAGAVLLAAALYELTPLKDTCLTRCRNPLLFVVGGWRPGRLGAVRMGMEHGAWCVGCCWALMAALFALGLMSLAWTAFVAALIAAEKLLPWRNWASRGVAVVLLVLALGVAFAPGSVPGLANPGSGEAMQSMEMGSGG
jgi:predicted metal-binding membrane protein